MKYDDYIVNIIECHMVLAGLRNFKWNAFKKIDKAIANNLFQISQHAGEKRFFTGEIYHPSNLLALCQYEFMLKKSFPYAHATELRRGIKIAINHVEKIRKIYGCPPFKEKDEIMIVEIISGDKVKAIIPELLDKFKGEFNRLLPIAPYHKFREFNKDMGGFINYNGDEAETVKFVHEMIKGEKDAF